MQILNFDFSNAEVFVFGDIMLDVYLEGKTSRVSPEAPVPVVLLQDQRHVLGGCGNVARNIQELGAKVSVSAFVGNDQNANLIEQALAQAKAANNNQLLVIDNFKTITKTRVISRHQQLVRLDEEVAVSSDYDWQQLWEKNQEYFAQQIAKANLVVLSDYNKGTRNLFPYIIALANQYQKPVIVDPKGNNYSVYNNASLLTPNYSEFSEIATQLGYSSAGIAANETAIVERIIKEYNLQGLLITKSELGMTLYYYPELTLGKITSPKSQLQRYHQNTYAEDVFDVTGAGDTVVATMATTLASGLALPESCYLANKAAGIVVSKFGTSTVAIHELEASCNLQTASEFSLQQVLQKVKQARSQGEKIVFTNGCFDILHRGHLSYLERAKELGDILIVGVNSDDSVRRLKGESRPINTASDRMYMLASLKSVDFVVEFSEDTPIELIKAIMPDVLVKGADYKAEEIVGYKEVTEAGGSVQTILFVDNYSTTNLISKIKG